MFSLEVFLALSKYEIYYISLIFNNSLRGTHLDNTSRTLCTSPYAIGW